MQKNWNLRKSKKYYENWILWRKQKKKKKKKKENRRLKIFCDLYNSRLLTGYTYKVLWHFWLFFHGRDGGKFPIPIPGRNLGHFWAEISPSLEKKNTAKGSLRSSNFFSQTSLCSPKVYLRAVRFARQKLSASPSHLAVFAHMCVRPLRLRHVG